MSEPFALVSSSDVLALLDRKRVTPPTAAPTLIPRAGIPTRMVISGGQTGADRAGLDAALAVGLLISGYCPSGRRAEDGAIPPRYELVETGTADYGERTRLNVKHSSATLIAHFDELTGGSLHTLKACRAMERPCLPVPLHPTLPASARMVAQVVGWLRKRQVIVLNVAGPRESGAPGIHAAALAFLTRVLGREVTTGDGEEAKP